MTSGESVTVAADRKRPRGLAAILRSQMRNIAPFLTLICLFSFFAVASPSFATLDNLGNILTQISVTGIIARVMMKEGMPITVSPSALTRPSSAQSASASMIAAHPGMGRLAMLT